MPPLHVSELRDDSIIVRFHVCFQKPHLALLNGHPFLIRNIRYISSRTVTKVTSTSIRRVAVLFMLLHRVRVISWNKIRYDIFNTCTMYTITLQCTVFNNSLNYAQTHLENTKIIHIQMELCNRTSVPATDSPKFTVRPPLTTTHI